MQSVDITITNPTGLHTRPGTKFVQEAKKYQSDIQVHKGEKAGNAKSLIKLLKIGISQGDAITLTASGDDEQEAICALRAFLETLHEEE